MPIIKSNDSQLRTTFRDLTVNRHTTIGNYSSNANATVITATSNLNENIYVTEASGYNIGYNMTAVSGTSPTTLSSGYNRFIVSGASGNGLQLPLRSLTTLGRIIHIRCVDSTLGLPGSIRIYAAGWADGVGTANEKIKIAGITCRYLSIYNSGFVELIRASPDPTYETSVDYGWIITRSYAVDWVE